MGFDARFSSIIGDLLNREGGLVNDPKDPGGLTKFGIAARYNPGVDIRNLTKDQAAQIYFDKYYRPSGAHLIEDDLLAELHFDAAVNQGVGAAKWFLNKSGGDVNQYASLRELAYRGDQSVPRSIRSTPAGFQRFGRGWLNRINGIMGVKKKDRVRTPRGTTIAELPPEFHQQQLEEASEEVLGLPLIGGGTVGDLNTDFQEIQPNVTTPESTSFLPQVLEGIERQRNQPQEIGFLEDVFNSAVNQGSFNLVNNPTSGGLGSIIGSTIGGVGNALTGVALAGFTPFAPEVTVPAGLFLGGALGAGTLEARQQQLAGREALDVPAILGQSAVGGALNLVAPSRAASPIVRGLSNIGRFGGSAAVGDVASQAIRNQGDLSQLDVGEILQTGAFGSGLGLVASAIKPRTPAQSAATPDTPQPLALLEQRPRQLTGGVESVPALPGGTEPRLLTTGRDIPVQAVEQIPTETGAILERPRTTGILKEGLGRTETIGQPEIPGRPFELSISKSVDNVAEPISGENIRSEPTKQVNPSNVEFNELKFLPFVHGKPKPRVGRSVPKFESDVDAALFIIAKREGNLSFADDKFFNFARSVFPTLSDEQIISVAQGVSRRVVRSSKAGQLNIPRTFTNVLDELYPGEQQVSRTSAVNTQPEVTATFEPPPTNVLETPQNVRPEVQTPEQVTSQAAQRVDDLKAQPAGKGFIPIGGADDVLKEFPNSPELTNTSRKIRIAGKVFEYNPKRSFELFGKAIDANRARDPQSGIALDLVKRSGKESTTGERFTPLRFLFAERNAAIAVEGINSEGQIRTILIDAHIEAGKGLLKTPKISKSRPSFEISGRAPDVTPIRTDDRLAAGLKISKLTELAPDNKDVQKLQKLFENDPIKNYSKIEKTLEKLQRNGQLDEIMKQIDEVVGVC